MYCSLVSNTVIFNALQAALAALSVQSNIRFHNPFSEWRRMLRKTNGSIKDFVIGKCSVEFLSTKWTDSNLTRCQCLDCSYFDDRWLCYIRTTVADSAKSSWPNLRRWTRTPTWIRLPFDRPPYRGAYLSESWQFCWCLWPLGSVNFRQVCALPAYLRAVAFYRKAFGVYYRLVSW